MNVAAPVFAALALVLTGPVPMALSRARWTHRAPRAALVLWQAVAIAAVLSAFGSGLAIASQLLVPGPDGRPTTSPTREIDALGAPLWTLSVIVFALTVLIGLRLMYAGIRVGVRTRRRRARHRILVDLLDRADSPVARSRRADSPVARARSSYVRVLDMPEPIAYCLPGVRRRVVLSEGTFTSLGDPELTAVLAHEHSHLRARHDLVLEFFTAVHEAFPRFVRSGSALGAVALLIELLADDSAVRATGPTPVARALVACSNSVAPQGALGLGGTSTLLRVQRLGEPAARRRIPAIAYLGSAAILVLPTIAVAVPWLVELERLLRG
ncbi:M56 family metallopeptidase [Aldersonia sp. NBC_00410]|uniref:M56 family metallopeptidase n=1 Tax=Aldersonia sp. NBC_00410 TaxID=2975954 RepID=UPI002257E03D|nr:M56 family metallopeptidase [Aldersonia sp. NBC_00410]MCX5044374.1 M56 family metallopeptidase [Aldersonia sp. NBC_00410]